MRGIVARERPEEPVYHGDHVDAFGDERLLGVEDVRVVRLEDTERPLTSGYA